MTGKSTIDAIITSDISDRGAIDLLSDAVAESQGDSPSIAAAELLMEQVSPDDTVLILTGFPIPPTFMPETDGPPGAVSIARAVDRLLDANPIIACEAVAHQICAETSKAGGLSVVDREVALQSGQTVAVESFPTDRVAAADYAQDIIENISPAAVIAVEKVGSNQEGVYHNSAGLDVSAKTAKVDKLFNQLSEDTPIVAVGDGGNEIGMGVVAETVRGHIEYGAECQCPCSQGIAAVQTASVLVPATVSNWGAYGVTAAVEMMTDEVSGALHSAESLTPLSGLIRKRGYVICRNL